MVDAVEKAGDRVTSINVQKLSLEDVFIHFTGRTLRDEPAQEGQLAGRRRDAAAALRRPRCSG